MGKIPAIILNRADYQHEMHMMKVRHNSFWEDVVETILGPRLDALYARAPVWLRRWAGPDGKTILLHITDMISDPMALTFYPDRYVMTVAEARPARVCFEASAEKITIMNIGYGNTSPFSAWIFGLMSVTPVFPLRDKVAAWILLREK